LMRKPLRQQYPQPGYQRCLAEVMDYYR
jgi:hypothetical protein